VLRASQGVPSKLTVYGCEVVYRLHQAVVWRHNLRVCRLKATAAHSSTVFILLVFVRTLGFSEQFSIEFRVEEERGFECVLLLVFFRAGLFSFLQLLLLLLTASVAQHDRLFCRRLV